MVLSAPIPAAVPEAPPGGSVTAGRPAVAEPGTATHPLDVEGVRAAVRRCLDAVLDRQRDVLAAVGEETATLVDAITALLDGGKRLRPAFCYWGWRGGGGAACDEIVTAATALELFHAAALVHDDVMDASDTRRGAPSAHRRFAALHARADLAGDGARFGEAAAILLGDLCLVWADEVFAGCGLDAERMARGRRVFDRMRAQLMGGQYLDMLAQATGAADVERSRAVIRWKSAKYTVEHPLLLGGALAGAAPRVLGAYSRYGLLVGEAFQLRDDVLGVFGDPAVTGKPAGDDVREGKRTVLVAVATQRATARQRAVLDDALGDPGLDDAGVDAVRRVLVDTGAVDHVEGHIGRLVALGRSALGIGARSDGLDAIGGVDPGAADVLDRLAVAATDRAA